uniref:Chromosome 16 open reading frame 72 n=1 Tax=Anser cygnoides TaxID=8845 RepID=A0A8B9IFV8_ANSCY
GAGPIVRRGLRAGAGQSASPAGCGRCRRCARCPGPGRSRSALPGPAPELPSEGGTKWRNLTWPFGVGDSKINSVCPSLPADRVCQQPGLSLWVPFQNAATAVTNLYKESVDAHQRSFDVGIQIGYQRRNKDVLAWVKKRRRTIRREDLISFLCGKVPPPRNTRAPPRLTVVSPNRATSTETSSSVETDLQPFREAIALHGLSGAMASISVRSSTPGSPTHVSSGSNASRRRNGLHDVDLNTFISEEMALHLDNGGTRKRTSAQCGDVITDSPTHKRNRMI